MTVSMAMIAAERAALYPDHPYAWVITRDRYSELRLAAGHNDEPSEVDTAGPAAATDEMVERASQDGRIFRMLDEGDIDEGAAYDGVAVDPAERGVVYEGRIWTRDEPGTETDRGPLYDFGTPNYGCTEIQYLINGRWETL